MVQRFQPIPGVVLGDVAGAKRIVMSEVDRAIAAIPGLAHDLDFSRLTASGGLLGRARASGGQVSAQGAGWSIVASGHLNGRSALRMDTATAFLVRLLRAFANPAFTIAVIGTMGSPIRDTIPSGSKNLITVYSSAGIRIWARLNSGTGNMGFSIGSGGGSSLPRASLPAANVGTLFSFERTAAGAMNIGLNGTTAVTGTDVDAPGLSADLLINIGGGNTLSNASSWDGDIARVVVWEGSVATAYPDLWAAFAVAAQAEYDLG